MYIYIYMYICVLCILVGGFKPSKMYESHSGFKNSQLNGKMTKMFQTTSMRTVYINK